MCGSFRNVQVWTKSPPCARPRRTRWRQAVGRRRRSAVAVDIVRRRCDRVARRRRRCSASRGRRRRRRSRSRRGRPASPCPRSAAGRRATVKSYGPIADRSRWCRRAATSLRVDELHEPHRRHPVELLQVRHLERLNEHRRVGAVPACAASTLTSGSSSAARPAGDRSDAWSRDRRRSSRPFCSRARFARSITSAKVGISIERR